MKLSIFAFLVVIGVVATAVKGHPGKTTTTIEHVNAEDAHHNGFWQKQVSWKPRWVKYWQQKAVYIPLWKKVWGPVVKNEWVPIPKPPPDWQEEIEHK